MSETKTTEEGTEVDALDKAPPERPEEAAPARASNGATNAADAAAEAGEARREDEGDEGDEERNAKATEADEERRGEDVLPRGNPLRKKRGGIALAVGGVPAFLLMAKNAQHAWAYPLGLVFVAIATFGVMDLVGTFDDDEEHVAAKTTLAELRMPLAKTALALALLCVSLWGAQAALGPVWLGAVTVTGTFLWLVAALFELGRALGPFRTDELGQDRPLLHRHGFWVIAASAFLYLPSLGLFSLWDPWETHYGEVAREILARDDWISLWWAQDGWFWSKPILNFWIQSLAMGALGTHFRPDEMLLTAGGVASARPEWVVRMPNVLMTTLAMYLLYKGVAKVFGRRAGLLGAFVLATMPDWYFLAHQTMTDMPFVAAMTAAMGLLLFGLNVEEEQRVKVYEIEAFGAKLRFSLWHVVFGAVLLCAIPQILYLLSRNIELVAWGDGPKGFRLHADEFRSGSGLGNCGLPGNEACTTQVPATVKAGTSWASKSAILGFFVHFEPAVQALVWSAVIGGALYLNWGERRVRRLVYIAAWLCAAIATMAKGPAGFGLPILCALAYIATKKRWSELLRFEMTTGFLVILAVALPWYVAMYVRHGSPFTDRLIFHDMFNRAFSHVHDTNEGDDTGLRYYVWQLGYALFPWTALAPLGLVWWLRRSDSADRSETGGSTGSAGVTGATGDASVMLVMWFLFAYVLFTFMGTKFHHYIFPAVPPIAMLIGVVLDDMLGERSAGGRSTLLTQAIGFTAASLLAVWGLSRFWPGSLFGAKEANEPSTFSAVALGGVAAVLFAIVVARTRGADGARPEDAKRRHEETMLGAAALLGAPLLVLVGRDLVIKPEGSDQVGAIRLLHLFTYNYRRPWPDTLDFAGALGAFTAVGALLCVAMLSRKIRRSMVGAFCAFAFVWALWGLDVYMVKLSPHWGQHELIEAYYRDRKGPDELLVAYQMNWKGENFYTGNKIPAFVSSGAKFQTWLKEQREKGGKVMYFITEHSRMGGLRSEVGGKAYKELTDKALCNKFVLVRAEL